ncbi:enoyl-CoA hydratase/isomerase family protein [Photobacterium sp. SDRW27]|uniref:enoyl-CoA hydratase/isomerase family protein n=1 Tax=Photobacterium obscurum TaxID=2829490 RepID=UPI002244C494|nr:enoyl-CoA hydratase/isomerase family protein [Photobacterium obscurum]MCW8329308.1 enoyl-CoA hydratase/isomerase family protein [Photobacterium obscurum]
MAGKVNFSKLACISGHNIGVAELDNPTSLNALTLDMLKQLKMMLEEWEKDNDIVCVFLHGAGEKAFCAGGDVRTMYQMMLASSHQQQKTQDNTAKDFLTEYFTVEYSCDYLIHRYSKPLIVWGNGIIMGGGIGLYVGASHRITTPSSRMAMPEISIGLYPDVGATWFLNRLPSGIGLFLGLTGSPINASDALDLKLTDHVLLPDQKQQALDELQGHQWGVGEDSYAMVTKLLSSLDEVAIPHHPTSQLIPYFDQIQQSCVGEDLADISRQIDEIDGTGRWIEQAKTTLKEGSPITATICFRLLTQYRLLSLEECFRLELTLSVRSGMLGEFQEGVRARLIDKCGQPDWIFKTIESVDQGVISELFTPLWSEADHPLAKLGAEQS